MKRILLILIVFSLILPCQTVLAKKDKGLEMEMEGKGYAGTLPDLTNKFQKKEEKVSTPLFESQKNFDNPAELKPIPRDNPSFINIIQKKDKTSAYVVDANEIIKLLEKLLDCIDDGAELQLFTTRCNVVTMNLDYLEKKYEGQPEIYYESFRKLMEINGYIKTVVQLRREAVKYQRYLAYQSTGSIYNPENINQQVEYLKNEINTTILILKQET